MAGLRLAGEFLWHLLTLGGAVARGRSLRRCARCAAWGGGYCGGCAGTRWIAAAP